MVKGPHEQAPQSAEKTDTFSKAENNGAEHLQIFFFYESKSIKIHEIFAVS